MPSRVYCNVQDHRLIDDKKTVEDVTKVGLPEFKNKTVTVDAAGMIMAVDMPDKTHFEAAEYTIYHNNGINGSKLQLPGKHTQEFRTVRQRYDVSKGKIVHESVKYRLVGVHASTQKGDIETGSPYGSTEKYALLRYEEEMNGKVLMIIDAMAGKITYNGKEYTDDVQSLLK
jgi:phage tail tube protein FII